MYFVKKIMYVSNDPILNKKYIFDDPDITG